MNSTLERINNEPSESFMQFIGELLVIAGKIQLEDACDHYSFATAYDNHMTAKAAWRDYQEWINA